MQYFIKRGKRKNWHTLENELEMTKETVKELRQETIPTMKNDKEFNTNTRESAMIIKSYGISDANASSAIKDTVETVSGQSTEGRMASASYVNNLSGDLKVLALEQLREVVDGAEMITIKHDGTTKKGHILTEVELKTESGTYTV